MSRPGILLLVFCASLLLFGRIAYATTGSGELWQWADLIPPPEPYDDPFLDLSQDQLDDLGYMVGLSADIASLEQARPDYSRLPAMRAQRDQLNEELRLQGVDVQYLLSKREEVTRARQQRAVATAEGRLGDKGSLLGFLVPLHSDVNSPARYFLVQFSPLLAYGHDHSAPDPNQTVLVELPRPWSAGLECPVIVSGVLQAAQFQQTVVTPDGHEMKMESSYGFHLASIELAPINRVANQERHNCAPTAN